VSLDDFVSWYWKVEKRVIPMDVILNILKDISSGMAYLHSRGIIHCDMNRGNFLISHSFCAKARFPPSPPYPPSPLSSQTQGLNFFKVSDLGLATHEYEIPSSHLTVGAPKFRAPDLVPTTKSDLWSFGILIGDLCVVPGTSLNLEVSKNGDDDQFLRHLAGFEAQAIRQRKATSVAHTIARIGKEEAGLGNFLVDLAKQCLEFDPKNRPEISEIFKKISENFIARPKFHERFVQHVGKIAEDRCAKKIEHRVAKILREIYTHMKLPNLITPELDIDSEVFPKDISMDGYVDLFLEKDLHSGAGEEKEIEALLDGGIQRIVIQGRVGSGKTTFLKWIAYQWAIGNRFQNFDVVAYVPLKTLPTYESLEKIMMHVLGLRKEEESLVTELLESQQAKILWLLDGWDEVQPTGALKLIRENIELRVKWLVCGTKPEGAMHIVCNTKVEIGGFSEIEKQKYVAHFFSVNGGLADRLAHVLQEKNYLNEICNLPLILKIVCTVFRKIEADPGKSDDQKITEIYSKIFEYLMCRTIHAMDLTRKLEKTIPKMENCLKFLGAQFLLKKATRKDDLSYQMVQNLGVLHVKNRMIHWNHHSFAEFFGAKYFFEQNDNSSIPGEFGLAHVFYSCFSKCAGK
jgi:hypothetical protein